MEREGDDTFDADSGEQDAPGIGPPIAEEGGHGKRRHSAGGDAEFDKQLQHIAVRGVLERVHRLKPAEPAPERRQVGNRFPP